MAPSSPPPPLLLPDTGASAFAAAQPQLLAALSSVHQLCLAAKDRQNASLQLHARLHQVFLRLAAAAARGSLSPAVSIPAFTALLTRLRRVLAEHVRVKNAVLRLLASRRLLAAFRQLHAELSTLATQWALASSPTSAALRWKPQLAVNVHLDEKTLRATLTALLSPSSSFVSKEFRGERRQLLVLLELACEVAPDRERWSAHSPELLETLRMVHKRIATVSGLHVRRVPRWFLPRSEVVVSVGADNHSRGLGRGSFGSTLVRADYYSVGSGAGRPRPAVVKYLWPLRDVYYTQVEHVFARTLQLWWHIDHPNVAQVHGASHVGAPPHLVRDYTAYGGLRAYIAAVQAHSKTTPAAAASSVERVTWELLYGAGKGLLYLHEHANVVHGALRCSNILVDKRGQPVIADYGIQALAAEVARHNVQVDATRIDDRELARWLAPECLVDADGRTLASDDASSTSSNTAVTISRAADVYAFGMCIVEAVSGDVPWSGLAVAEVRSLKQTLGVLPPRPKRLHANAWGLVQRMCAFDPTRRLSLREVLAEIKALGYFGYGNQPPVHTDSPDPSIVDGDGDAESHNSDGDDDADSYDNAVALPTEHPDSTPVGDSNAIVSDATSAAELTYDDDQGHQDADFLDFVQPRSVRKNGGSNATGATRVSVAVEPQAEELVIVDDTVKGDQAANDTVVKADALLLSASDGPVVHSPVQSDSATTDEPMRVVDSPAATRKSDNAATTRLSRDVTVVVEEGKQQEHNEPANIWRRLDEDAVVERISVRLDVVKVASEYHDARVSFDDDKDGDVAATSEDGPDALVKTAGSVEVVRDVANVVTEKRQGEKSLSVASTVEPELEIDALDSLFFDTCKAGAGVGDGSSTSRTSPADDAPLSLTSEIRNRIRSGGRGGDRSSFLDNLLRATTLRTEYMTARETSDAVAAPSPPPLSTPKYVDLVEVLKDTNASAETVLHVLQQLRHGVHLGKKGERLDWTERGGFAALFAVLERSVSPKCTCVALEILVDSAVQSPMDIEAMVECGAVAILLAFLERSSACEELDLVASFLLEILASSDAAKHELWASDGIATVEANSSIDRRLVQEVKSIMAKFKSSEGYKHMHAGECDLAIERFSEAIALDRKRATYYCDRSLAYYEASLFKKAADDAARCMRYNPYDVIGYLRNGVALKALGRYNEAIVCLRKGRQVDPKFAKIRDVIAEIEDLRRGRSRESASDEASVSPEEIVKAKKKSGDDALRKKQYELAIQSYTEALAIDRRNDVLYLHRSIAYSGCNMFDKAIEDASRCIHINYRHSEGYYRLALALHSVGQYDQALRTLYRGQEVDSRHAAIRRFIQQLETEEAERAGLDLPAWFKERGYQAFQLRSYEEAIKFYSKGIAASKSDHDAVALHCFFYRARANQCRGEFGAVVMDCTHILHHNPKNVFARLRRADAYEQQRDYFMALQDMQELVMFNPDFESARARLESLEVRCRFLPRTNLQHGL